VIRLVSLAVIIILAASPATPAADRLHPALEACAALKKSAERLACYDRAVAQLAAGQEPDPRATSSVEMFGIDENMAPKDRSAPAVKREQLAKITARVRSLRTTSDGTLVIELDNDQAWQQLSAGSLVLEPGDSVTISRAAFGSFRLAAPSNRYARVRRVR
jgi:hypothetical protein